jgi:multidrug efflux pump
MIGVIDWAAQRSRMVLAFIAMSVIIGWAAYFGLPKEGEPDIEIPALFVSVPFPGISAEDSEKLLVKVMEAKFQDLDGLKKMSGNASENYAGVALEFDFGWDKAKILADVRDKMTQAEAEFPFGADKYSVNEINFSEFPILIVSISGDLPERTLLKVAKNLKETIESLPEILEATLSGQRDEMLEVIIDPLALETYNVSATDLIKVVNNNNLLVAAGKIETSKGAYSVKIPSSFNNSEDVFGLPIKVNGDRVVTLGELADIRLTFEDRVGTARFNGRDTIALQVVKRKGFNIIDTSAAVRLKVNEEVKKWPIALQNAVKVDVTLDQSKQVRGMVSQLEGSVLTAIALVMIVVLASLGTRSALLVGFSIPTSFLLCFILLGIMGVSVSNIVMFGLILAVGMLVDSAIVIVEYADRKLSEGLLPMEAYTAAAKRMFWPIVSSTATTLCAFLPMLFWPGVAGEFMGMLPVTLIFVLSASLIVALIYLPIVGGVSANISKVFINLSTWLKNFHYTIRLVFFGIAFFGLFVSAMQLLNPSYLLPIETSDNSRLLNALAVIFFVIMTVLVSIGMDSISIKKELKTVSSGYKRTYFGHFTKLIAGNPVMPLVAIGLVTFCVITIYTAFIANNKGVEFFVESETEQAVVYVRARGNLSLEEKDSLTRKVENELLTIDGIEAVFAFAGAGGLRTNDAGATSPLDSIGKVQIELSPWGKRRDDVEILEEARQKMNEIPGIKTEIMAQAMGPGGGKPINLRLKGSNWVELQKATKLAREKFEKTFGLIDVEDTLPLPGIDWQINVDVEAAGRYGADVQMVGAMVQLVTRGLLLDTMRVDSSDEEIEIRVRLPKEQRVLSTLDNLKVGTRDGLIPLSQFVSRKPVPSLSRIDRVGQSRFFDVKADFVRDLKNDENLPVNANERIEKLTNWILNETPFPPSVTFEWTGNASDEAESQAFLGSAFAAALGLMFIILLAQFNSFYNSALVLLAVILSTSGVLLGMLIMDQTFSVIMTGTGIVALAGIVVNNNIVLIDTYSEYSRYMPKIEAIIRTAEARIRPVLLTSITTMAGLTPMMFGLSLDFINGGYTIDSPTAVWWKQLATAVVFGLGVATILTLILTPALLALRVWLTVGAYSSIKKLSALGARNSQSARDLTLQGLTRKLSDPLLIWEFPREPIESTSKVNSKYRPKRFRWSR